MQLATIKKQQMGPAVEGLKPNTEYYWMEVNGTKYTNPAVLVERIAYTEYYQMPCDEKIAVDITRNNKRQVLFVECVFVDAALGFCFTFKNLYDGVVFQIPFSSVTKVFRIIKVIQDITTIKSTTI